MIQAQPTTQFEECFWQNDMMVAGVDEAGRGALAGPVVAAAVILPKALAAGEINDSKKLTAQKRSILSRSIMENCIAYGVGMKDERHIETNNVLQATMHAMYEAIDLLIPQPAHLLIDGNYFRSDRLPFTTIIDGDALCLSIAAASILAKVTRDRWMVEVADVRYPDYGFAQHKGYATNQHCEAIRKYGPCELHRQTFLTRILAEHQQRELFE